jgi:hypothetical protein
MPASPDVIPNQVFLGVPWKTVRARYERVADELRKKYPLSFVIVGRDASQDAEDLLEIIKARLEESSYAIFDATGGNANVSLEFGYAEARNVQRVLYVSTHAATRRSKDAPIIADLAGKRRQQYAQEPGLQKLLGEFAKNHPYTKRFERFVISEFRSRTRGRKRRARTLALKVVHKLDGSREVRRDDIVQPLLAADYSRDEIDDMIRRLHRRGLVRSIQGPYSKVRVT